MKKPTTGKRRVKAWAVVLPNYGIVYKLARNTPLMPFSVWEKRADAIAHKNQGGFIERAKAVPCEIVYTLPKKKV